MREISLLGENMLRLRTMLHVFRQLVGCLFGCLVG
jgi:hypothetical protein